MSGKEREKEEGTYGGDRTAALCHRMPAGELGVAWRPGVSARTSREVIESYP